MVLPDLDIIIIDGKNYVSSIDLYDRMNLGKRSYRKWVRVNITEQPQNLPMKGRDYLERESEYIGKPGPIRTDFLLSIDFAKELCYQAKTSGARACRDFLYSLPQL